jgi:hypothetical protein
MQVPEVNLLEEQESIEFGTAVNRGRDRDRDRDRDGCDTGGFNQDSTCDGPFDF